MDHLSLKLTRSQCMDRRCRSRLDAVRKEKAAQEKEGGERRAKGQARERERPAEP